MQALKDSLVNKNQLCPDIPSFEVKGNLFTERGLVLEVSQKPNLTKE